MSEPTQEQIDVVLKEVDGADPSLDGEVWVHTKILAAAYRAEVRRRKESEATAIALRDQEAKSWKEGFQNGMGALEVVQAENKKLKADHVKQLKLVEASGMENTSTRFWSIGRGRVPLDGRIMSEAEAVDGEAAALRKEANGS